MRRTSTKDAPWYIIPADHKWFRNWAVADVLLRVLKEMDPQYPEGEPLPIPLPPPRPDKKRR